MDNNKFDFKCIFYTNKVIEALVNAPDFEEMGIDPENLRYIVLQLSQNNFDNVGKEILSEEQYQKAVEKSRNDSLKESLGVMLKDGLIEISGMDKDGEFIMKISQAGLDEYNKNKAKEPEK